MEVKYIMKKDSLRVIQIDKDGEKDVTEEYNNRVLPGEIDYTKEANRNL